MRRCVLGWFSFQVGSRFFLFFGHGRKEKDVRNTVVNPSAAMVSTEGRAGGDGSGIWATRAVMACLFVFSVSLLGWNQTEKCVLSMHGRIGQGGDAGLGGSTFCVFCRTSAVV